MVKIALAQINPIVGDLKGNSAKIIEQISLAKKKGAELLIFGELALTGYPPEDLVLKKHFISRNKYFLNIIKEKCSGITVLVGFIDKKKDGVYNSCAVIADKKIQDIYHKITLPNYGVFDEKRYFTSGNELPLYTFKNYKFVISICEDIWEENFTDLLKGKDIDFIVNISASPFHLGKFYQREETLSKAAKKLKSFVFYCNLVGGQDEIVFDGTSKILSAQGKVILCAKRFCENLSIFNFDRDKKYLTEKVKINPEEEAFSALRLGIYDYIRKNKFKKVVIGVSGGIDSAVVVAMAAIALGRENVCALIMPSIYSSKETFADAKKICKNLGVKYHIIDINNILQPYLKDLAPHFKSKTNTIVQENLQARIRGNILMAFSNEFGYIVLNTGNKSEVSCGYCTLYGDMVGGFGVLKDVPKLLVYKLSNYVNKFLKKKVIPISVIERPPSAELKPNQKDTDSLPDYELLDPILKLYIEKDYSLEEIVSSGFKKNLVEKIIAMVDSNEYKRRQSPVGIKITPKAFGRDRRMPITNKFVE